MGSLSSFRNPFTTLYDHLSPDVETSILKGYKRPVLGLKLCIKCKVLKYRCWGKVTHYPDYAQLQSSAAKGCWLCQAVHQQFGLALQDSIQPAVWTDPSELRRGALPDLLLWFANNTVTASGYLDELKGSDYYQYLYGPRLRPLQEDPSSETTFNLIRGWLNLCNAEHRCYQAKYHQYISPTRLIDVSGPDPQLVLGETIQEPYVTLSHCWGKAQPLITTISNLDDRLRGVSHQTLPRLFQDAIFVTKTLGIRYLWIDSLCIIQDSKDDWTREAAQMGDVYRRAYFTLFALDAIDCHHSILAKRNQYSGKTEFQQVESVTGDKTTIFQQSTLCHRAWALQERLLSPRVLFYSNSEIFWECLSCTAREGSSRIEPYRPSEYSHTSYECPDVKNCLILPQGRSPSMPLSPPSDWYIIVVEYTRCFLTMATDKLPAIAGLAAIFQTNTGYSYMAGLWQEDFRGGLLWYVDHIQDQARHSKLEVPGPTWSWMSSCFPVLYVTVTDSRSSTRHAPHRDIRLISCRLYLQSANNLMGEAIYDSITVEADAEVLEIQTDDTGIGIFDQNRTKVNVFFDDLQAIYPSRTKCHGLYISTRDSHGTNPVPRNEVWAGIAYISWIYFLVVVPDDGLEGCWKRIGLGRCPESQGLFKENSERMLLELV